jgi:hypothetical protein
MPHPLYLLYGLLLIGGVGWMQYRGVASVWADEVRNVPKSVRDNPGSYRSHYASTGRYYGGK